MKVTLNLISCDKACALGLQIAHIYLYFTFFVVSFHKYTIKSSQYLINVSVVGNEKVETQVQFYVLIVSKQAPKTVLRTVNIFTILTSSATGIIPTVVFISCTPLVTNRCHLAHLRTFLRSTRAICSWSVNSIMRCGVGMSMLGRIPLVTAGTCGRIPWYTNKSSTSS